MLYFGLMTSAIVGTLGFLAIIYNLYWKVLNVYCSHYLKNKDEMELAAFMFSMFIGTVIIFFLMMCGLVFGIQHLEMDLNEFKSAKMMVGFVGLTIMIGLLILVKALVDYYDFFLKGK